MAWNKLFRKEKKYWNGSSELYCSNVFKSDQLVDRLNLDDLGLYECWFKVRAKGIMINVYLFLYFQNYWQNYFVVNAEETGTIKRKSVAEHWAIGDGGYSL